MSDEYIRKADAITAACKGFCHPVVRCPEEPCREQTKFLLGLPPADVAPVVHGKWMKEDRGRVEYCAVCDQCGFDWMWSDRGYFKFCPNCGAKMDGEEDENG